MTDENAQERSIFSKAVNFESSEDLAAFLNEACQGSAELRAKVESLLEANRQTGDLLDLSAMPGTIVGPVTEQPGTQIGPYILLQKIGEGGMGVVYVAEQREPVKRRVALKIIKPGMDTQQVINRFEAERQALAMMDHPNIAKVLDAGATESGRPYFVMELVNGISVTQYCDEQHLTPKERLELFLPICQAVQHPHQKGIIHRDLKPSNVMIALYDDRAVPKVIDFGVAKATSQMLTEKTIFTQLGQVVGTLEYMSPEQAQRNQLDIDTRSDIYSLGVLLYELLTGDTPFDRQRLRSAAFDEMLRIIREEEPLKPSTKVSGSESLASIAANRKIEPAKLSVLVRGELDWIVMKALEKDRGRRYSTATSFAEDIQHYLNDEAVVACPPSARYRFKKFAKRNKVRFATATAIALSLIVGTSVATWQAVRATNERNRALAAEELAHSRFESEQHQRQRAEQAESEAKEHATRAETEAAIARAVYDYLGKDLLGMADPVAQVSGEIAPDPDIKLRTVLDRAAHAIKGRFSDQPLVEAAIRGTIGNTYRAVGEFELSKQQQSRALELRKTVAGPEHPSTLSSMNSLAQALVAEGRDLEAETLLRQTLQIRTRTLGSEQQDTLATMGMLAGTTFRQGRSDEAESLFRQILKTSRRVLGREHPVTLANMGGLASVLIDQAKYAEAEELLRQTLEVETSLLGSENPSTLFSMHNLAIALSSQGRFAEAEELQRRVLDCRRRVLGPDHPDTLMGMNSLASTLKNRLQYSEAEMLLRKTLEIETRVLGAEHPNTLRTKHSLADVISRQERYAEAEELLQQVLQIRRRILGPEHRDTLRSLQELAVAIGGQNQFIEADALYRETLEIMKRVRGPEHPDTLASMNDLANSVFNQGRYAEAERLQRQVLQITQRVLSPEHPNTINAIHNLATSISRQRRHAEAEELYRQILQISQQVLGSEHPYTLETISSLANSVFNQSRYAEAERLQRELLDMQQRILGNENRATLANINNLAFTLNKQDHFEEAEELYRQLLGIRRRVLGDDAPETLHTLFTLAGNHADQREFTEAEVLLQEAVDKMWSLGDDYLTSDPLSLKGMCKLVDILTVRGKLPEASQQLQATLQLEKRILEHRINFLNAIHTLAHQCERAGDFDDAERLHQEVVAARIKLYGEESPITQHARQCLKAFHAKRAQREAQEKAKSQNDGQTQAQNDAAWNWLRPDSTQLKSDSIASETAGEAQATTHSSPAQYITRAARSAHPA